jgi:hypothetical protein
MAQHLLRIGHAALSYLGADGLPGISRIAHGHDGEGVSLTLISALAPHVAGLAANPDCALMLGEPGGRGDPLTHPRLMIRAQAVLAPGADRAALRVIWLNQHPKAKLYVDFSDFAFVRLRPVSGILNAGFGKAFVLAPENLRIDVE